LQPRGWALAAAGAALMIAGLWRIDGVLATLGLAAWSLLGLVWWLARWNARGLEIGLDCPGKVRAGVVFPMTITLANPRRWLDAFGIRIDCELAGMVRACGRAAWVAAGSAADLELKVSMPGRGWRERHELRLDSDFPFGLFEVVRVLEVAHALWVFPKPVFPGNLNFSGGAMDTATDGNVAAGEALGEPSGMRAWRAGDSPRRIAWPVTLRAFARGAGLIVRESEPPGFRPTRCAVVFHSFSQDGGLIRPDRFERALSLAAGTLKHLRAQGVSVRWIADFQGWKSRPMNSRGEVNACLEGLCRATRAMDTEAHNLQAALAGVGDDEGLIVVSDMPVSDWSAFLPRDLRAAIVLDLSERKRVPEVVP
jgi:uncharacterized protein (DUF58 family)